MNKLRPESYVMKQNHDWPGNRPPFIRLEREAPLDACRMAAVLLAAVPGSKMLFQGQEYAEQSPFCYFREVLSPDLQEAIREGRRRENAEFFTNGEVPDAFSEDTLRLSSLKLDALEQEPGAGMNRFYTALLGLFRNERLMWDPTRSFHAEATGDEALILSSRLGDEELLVVAHLGRIEANIPLVGRITPGASWSVLLDSEGYKPSGHPVRVNMSQEEPSVRFTGPGAVILKKGAER